MNFGQLWWLLQIDFEQIKQSHFERKFNLTWQLNNCGKFACRWYERNKSKPEPICEDGKHVINVFVFVTWFGPKGGTFKPYFFTLTKEWAPNTYSEKFFLFVTDFQALFLSSLAMLWRERLINKTQLQAKRAEANEHKELAFRKGSNSTYTQLVVKIIRFGLFKQLKKLRKSFLCLQLYVVNHWKYQHFSEKLQETNLLIKIQSTLASLQVITSEAFAFSRSRFCAQQRWIKPSHQFVFKIG